MLRKIVYYCSLIYCKLVYAVKHIIVYLQSFKNMTTKNCIKKKD